MCSKKNAAEGKLLRRRCPVSKGLLARADADLLRAAFFRFGKRDLENALIELSGSLLRFNLDGKADRAGEGFVTHLFVVVAAVFVSFVGLFVLLATRDGEDVVFDVDVNVALIKAGCFDVYDNVVFLLIHIKLRFRGLEARKRRRRRAKEVVKDVFRVDKCEWSSCHTSRSLVCMFSADLYALLSSMHFQYKKCVDNCQGFLIKNRQSKIHS